MPDISASKCHPIEGLAMPQAASTGDGRSVAFTLDNMPWGPENPDGTRSALLAGTRDPGVVFTYAFFIPAGVWDPPHSHVAAARLVVASGELRLGYGNELAREQAQRLPAGSFLFVPASMAHFDGAEVDTVIVGTAVGPWTTDYL